MSSHNRIVLVNKTPQMISYTPKLIKQTQMLSFPSRVGEAGEVVAVVKTDDKKVASIDGEKKLLTVTDIITVGAGASSSFDCVGASQGNDGWIQIAAYEGTNYDPTEVLGIEYSREGRCWVTSAHSKWKYSFDHIQYHHTDGDTYNTVWFYDVQNLEKDSLKKPFQLDDLSSVDKGKNDKIWQVFKSILEAPASKFPDFDSPVEKNVFQRISKEISRGHSNNSNIREHYSSLLDTSWDAHANHLRILRDKGPKADEWDDSAKTEKSAFDNVCKVLISEFEDINDVHAYVALVDRIMDQKMNARHFIAAEVKEVLNLDHKLVINSNTGPSPTWHAQQMLIAAMWGVAAVAAPEFAVPLSITASLFGSYADTIMGIDDSDKNKNEQPHYASDAVSVTDYLNWITEQQLQDRSMFKTIDTRLFSEPDLIKTLLTQLGEYGNYKSSDAETFILASQAVMRRFLYSLLLPKVFYTQCYTIQGTDKDKTQKATKVAAKSNTYMRYHSKTPADFDLLFLMHRKQGTLDNDGWHGITNLGTSNLVDESVTDAILKSGLTKEEIMDSVMTTWIYKDPGSLY